MTIRVLFFPEAAIPVALHRQVVELHAPGVAPAHDPALRPLSMLLVADGRVLSALDILSKTIVHRGRSYSASGLSRVVTDQSHRHRSYGTRLVIAARAAIETGGADLGIFTCDRPLQPFYERCGWHALVDTTLIGGTPDRPCSSGIFDKITLAGFFSPKAIHHAHDFVRCQIELYPGEIDRLW